MPPWARPGHGWRALRALRGRDGAVAAVGRGRWDDKRPPVMVALSMDGVPK